MLVRGISLECLFCREFVLRTRRTAGGGRGSHLRGAVESVESGGYNRRQGG